MMIGVMVPHLIRPLKRLSRAQLMHVIVVNNQIVHKTFTHYPILMFENRKFKRLKLCHFI